MTYLGEIKRIHFIQKTWGEMWWQMEVYYWRNRVWQWWLDFWLRRGSSGRQAVMNTIYFHKRWGISCLTEKMQLIKKSSFQGLGFLTAPTAGNDHKCCYA